MKRQESSVRLFVILARESPWAVVFRRGPTDKVLLVRWNVERDVFEPGQWLRGRIYERRCDLSPDGELLVYFAAQWRKAHGSWTAVSRPPYFQALALWPKGDTWGGGGRWESNTRLALLQAPKLAPGFEVPKWLEVAPSRGPAGDEGGWSMQLERGGWTCTPGAVQEGGSSQGGPRFAFTPAPTWRKPNPVAPERYGLELQLLGIGERNGPWHVTAHTLRREGKREDKLGRTDWADWAPSGDLLFAMDGRMYRLKLKRRALGDLEGAEEIADFRKWTYDPKPAPDSAGVWPKKPV